MRVLRGNPGGWDVGPGVCAATIGVFDGFHTGHAEVIAYLSRRATAMGRLPMAVVTFDPHPLAIVAPERAPRLLTTLERRLELLDEAGVDTVAVLTFDEEVRDLDAAGFCELVLSRGLGARLVVVGEDFRFGRDRSGNVETMRKLGDHFGYEVDVVGLLSEGDVPVSSTGIRRMVGAGHVDAAGRALGRRYELSGTVVVGAHRGAGLGYPTANLAVPREVLIPARGVYAAQAFFHDDNRPAVVNVGVRPTFDGTHETVEAHLLDFAGDLYGERMRLEFVARLRPERRFDGPAALAAQITSDVAAARAALRG